MMTELSATGHALRRQFPAGGRVLCAVSGGLDSMCLLHFMTDWGAENGFTVTVAHFNHHLREDADRDETFVRDWCAAHDISFFAGQGNVRDLAEREGLSIEEAARKLRYAFLEETAAQEGCAAILTAHHADDNAETMLLNLVRGTGLKGLCGIPQARGILFRPFLSVPRTELAEYAAAHDLPHVEDATNGDPDAAARNLLRLQVLPLLRQLNPRAVEHMNHSAALLREADDAMDEVARRCLRRASLQPGRVTIRLGDLAEVPEPVLPRVLLGLFDLLGVGRKDIGAVHLEALAALARRGKGQLDLPHGVTARLAASRLILETLPTPASRAELVSGCPLRWGGYTLTLLDHREGEGLALCTGPAWETVSVSPCPAGERLTLPGTNGGARSIKRLCLDRRIPLTERDRLPAIFVDDRLAAVWRLGVDIQFLPEGRPCRFIQIKAEKEEIHHEK